MGQSQGYLQNYLFTFCSNAPPAPLILGDGQQYSRVVSLG